MIPVTDTDLVRRPDGGFSAPRLDTKSPMMAAVDLGSNSFRMVIARRVGDELRLVDRLREGVRLAGYLDADQHIEEKGIERALGALEIFGQRLRDFPSDTVRAVGTNTLRKARNAQAFLKVAQQALGHPIEVVSGQEEARLIFVGVAHSLAGDLRRVVVDIGGGSTECIIGQGPDPQVAASLYMGCVGYTQKFFSDGCITAKQFREAETAARLELRSIKADFKRRGWEQAVGSSGTAQAVADILRAQGWSDGGITSDGMQKLKRVLLEAATVDNLHLEGLRRERTRVLAAGLAILIAAFDSLRIERMVVSPGAMREGLLYDLYGRLSHRDAREPTILRFVSQYRVDVEQARRVGAVALDCLRQVADGWGLDLEPTSHVMRWAAQLHEIGLAVSHGAYHKHGAYLLEHSDMPGFSMQDQALLALLVRGHRRKFPRELFYETLPKSRARQAIRLCRLLRLACVLARSRSTRELPRLRLEAKGKKLTLRFPVGWLDRHPLTEADLWQESERMESVGYRLEVGHYDPGKKAEGKSS